MLSSNNSSLLYPSELQAALLTFTNRPASSVRNMASLAVSKSARYPSSLSLSASTALLCFSASSILWSANDMSEAASSRSPLASSSTAKSGASDTAISPKNFPACSRRVIAASLLIYAPASGQPSHPCDRSMIVNRSSHRSAFLMHDGGLPLTAQSQK